MKYFVQMVFIFSFFFLSSCNDKEEQKLAISVKPSSIGEISESEFRILINKEKPKCKILFNTHNEILKRKEVLGCISNTSNTSHVLLSHLVDKLLKHQPPVSKIVLNATIKEIAEDFHTSKYTDIIKWLMNAGASTEKINLKNITNGHDIMCETTVLILKSNKHLYQHESLLNTRIDGLYRKEDLIYQSDTDNGRAMCPEAIRLLISYNPELRNVQSERGTPLDLYLLDKKHPDWDVEITKSLITKKNINMQSNRIRATPLHSLLYHHYNESSYDLEIIVAALKLGADIDLKDTEGITVRDLIKKRADLVSLLE